MKIGNFVDKSLLGVGSRSDGAGSSQSASKAASADGSVGKSATVTLSAAASVMSEDSAVFDSAKVARIKQAVDSGTYKVNPEAIADKLIGNAKELVRGG